MLHQDYIMRQIAQLVEVLRRILALTKTDRPPDTLAAIDAELEELFGLDSRAMARLSTEGLLTRLTWGVEAAMLGRTKAVVVAALLKEAGSLHTAEEQPDESYACHLSALELLLTVYLQSPQTPLPDYAPSVEVLTAALADYMLPLETNRLLFAYYEQRGAYATAEDTLFEMIRDEPQNIELVEQGIAFYERLLGRSDEQLIAGTLPREEVEAGLAELVARRNG